MLAGYLLSDTFLELQHGLNRISEIEKCTQCFVYKTNLRHFPNRDRAMDTLQNLYILGLGRITGFSTTSLTCLTLSASSSLLSHPCEVLWLAPLDAHSS
jgi:hypothetical protein